MFETALSWIENHQTFVQCAVILVTGACAIVAAKIGFRGAQTQALAAQEVFQRQTALERKSAAAALAAELSSMIVNLSMSRHMLRRKSDKLRLQVRSSKSDFPVFASTPQIIASVPPVLAAQVVRAYIEYDQLFEYIRDNISGATLSLETNEARMVRQDVGLFITARIMNTKTIAEQLLEISDITIEDQIDWWQWLADKGVDEGELDVSMSRKTDINLP